MKTTIFTFLTLAFLGLSTTYAQVGIGTATPNSDAILEVDASDKGVLIPRLALTDTIAHAPLSAHVEGMLVYNTTTDFSKGLRPGYYHNDGTKWILLLTTENQNTGSASDFSNIVYVDATSPSTANIFDLASPPTTNDNDLKENPQNLYIGTNGEGFVWDGTAYVPIDLFDATPWNLRGSTLDAGNDKNAHIERYGDVYIQDVRVGTGEGDDDKNTLIGGGGAFGKNTTGVNTVAIGYAALAENTTGTDNVAMGHEALKNNVAGSYNVAVGEGALKHATGSYNHAIGAKSFTNSGLTGGENVGIGFETGKAATGASNLNTFIGNKAGSLHQEGNNNTAIGANASFVDVNGSNRVSIQNSLFAINASATAPGQAVGSWGVNEPAPKSTFDVNGSFGANIRVVSLTTATYTVQGNDHTLIFEGSAQPLQLPPVGSTRRIITIRNNTNGNFNINGHIDGTQGTFRTLNIGKSLTFQSNGSTWYVIDGF